MSTKRPRIKLDNLRLFDKIDTGDTFYTNVSLLLHFDGPNTSTNVKDFSKYAHSVVVMGTSQISTLLYKFGASSLNTGAFGNDYIYILDSESLQLGTGDFTIEFWLYWENAVGYQTILNKGDMGTNAIMLQSKNASTALKLYIDGIPVIEESSGPSTHAWTHYALVRNSGIVRLYRNGAQTGSTGSNVDLNHRGRLDIGGESTSNAHVFDGSIDELRITKGVARYTSTAFTVPTKVFHDSPGDVNKKVIVDEEAKGLGIGEGGIDESRLAHAWITFDGHDPTTSIPKILDSYNVSSIAEIGVGNYTIHYNQPLVSSNSCVVATIKEPNIVEIFGGTNPRSQPMTQNVQVVAGNHTANSVDIRVNYGSTVSHRFDSERISVIVFSN